MTDFSTPIQETFHQF